MPDKRHTTKQFGDAGEMLVIAELTLHGVPALKAPDMWPGCDVIAWLNGEFSQRISVKTRTYTEKTNLIRYHASDKFDWLAIVLLPISVPEHERNFITPDIFIVPREVADQRATLQSTHWNPNPEKRTALAFWVRSVDKLPSKNPHGLGDYRNNYTLSRSLALSS